MKYMLLSQLIFLTICKSFSANLYSITSGNWESTFTWSYSPNGTTCNCMPQGGDVITIQSGKTVSVTTNTTVSGASINLYDYGTFYFDNGKLTVPSGSTVSVMATNGLIQTSTGNGARDQLMIGTTRVWQSSDGNQGPGTTFTDAPLPVDFLTFSVDRRKDHVFLEWETSFENNNDRFDVQRSLDGFEFATFTSVNGVGNSNSLNTYHAVDNCFTSIIYYRIKQVDVDGKFSYSKTIQISSEDSFQFSIYPNPANKGSFIKIASGRDESVNAIFVYDVTGKCVWMSQEPCTQFSSESFDAGVYQLKVTTKSGNTENARLVIY